MDLFTCDIFMQLQLNYKKRYIFENKFYIVKYCNLFSKILNLPYIIVYAPTYFYKYIFSVQKMFSM